VFEGFISMNLENVLADCDNSTGELEMFKQLTITPIKRLVNQQNNLENRLIRYIFIKRILNYRHT